MPHVYPTTRDAKSESENGVHISTFQYEISVSIYYNTRGVSTAVA